MSNCIQDKYETKIKLNGKLYSTSVYLFPWLLTINFINIQVFKYDYLQNNKKLHRIFTGVLKGNMMWFEPPKENDYKCI